MSIIDGRTGRLNVFELFQVDQDLPRAKQGHQRIAQALGPELVALVDELYPAEESQEDSGTLSATPLRGATMWPNPRRLRRMGNVNITAEESRMTMTVGSHVLREDGFWCRLVSLILGVFGLYRYMKEPKPTELEAGKPGLSVEEFFHSVKDSAADIEKVEVRAANYGAAIAKARKAGQVALVEKLVQSIDVVRSEGQLLALCLPRVVTEEQLVAFARQCPRGLCLDWMANFTRMIPDELVARVLECNERMIFDNYVVLHYDPAGKNTSLTKAEKEARKDPILFGVIEGSRKLYFLGDWKDELCDLTLEQIVAVIGEEGIAANTITEKV